MTHRPTPFALASSQAFVFSWLLDDGISSKCSLTVVSTATTYPEALRIATALVQADNPGWEIVDCSSAELQAPK